MSKKHIEKFCREYEAEVYYTGRKVHRATPPIINPFFDNDFHHQYTQPYEEIELVEIRMTKDGLNALLEKDERVREIMDPKFFGQRHPADRIWDEYEEEVRIRNRSVTVKQAYEKYLNLLYLAGYRGRG